MYYNNGRYDVKNIIQRTDIVKKQKKNNCCKTIYHLTMYPVISSNNQTNSSKLTVKVGKIGRWKDIKWYKIAQGVVDKEMMRPWQLRRLLQQPHCVLEPLGT